MHSEPRSDEFSHRQTYYRGARVKSRVKSRGPAENSGMARHRVASRSAEVALGQGLGTGELPWLADLDRAFGSD